MATCGTRKSCGRGGAEIPTESQQVDTARYTSHIFIKPHRIRIYGDDLKSASQKTEPLDRLSIEAREIFARLCSEFELEAEQQLILTAALESFDVMRAAQEHIARDGLIGKDRFEQLRLHPAAVLEREARAAYVRGIASLGLAFEPLHDGPGRPPGT